MELRFLSCQGGRQYNEDRVWGSVRDDWFCGAVADGLGGHGGGDVAAETAIQTLSHSLEPDTTGIFHLQKAVCLANANILKAQSASCRMCTTLALILGKGKEAIAAHVGDSRIYHFRDAQILYQSMDHSASQIAVALGEISLEEIRGHDDRSILLRALGGAEQVTAECKALEVQPGDRLLLCTDGFWEGITEDQMEQTCAACPALEQWLESMATLVMHCETRDEDNYTALVIQI